MRVYFVKKCKLLKSKSDNPYIEELTVFIRVKIDNLNEFSKLISPRLNRDVKVNKEIIKIRIVRKYLFISSKLNLISVNNNLLIYIFFGLLKDNI